MAQDPFAGIEKIEVADFTILSMVSPLQYILIPLRRSHNSITFLEQISYVLARLAVISAVNFVITGIFPKGPLRKWNTSTI